MTALNSQITAIDEQEAALLRQIEALQAKKRAVAELEGEYQATIDHVKATIALMVEAGLDPRNLAKDISALCLPVGVTSNRSTSRSTSTSGNNTKLNRPGPDTQGGKAWQMFDDILAELGNVTTAEVKIRAAVSMPHDSIQNIVWHLSNWRKAQQLNASPSPVPVVEPEPSPEVTTPPVIVPPILSPDTLTEAEKSSIDKRIEAEMTKKTGTKKVK